MNIFEELNNKLKAFIEEDYIEHEEISSEEMKAVKELYVDAVVHLDGLKNEDDILSVCNHISAYVLMDGYNDDVYTVSIATDNREPNSLQGIRVYLDKETHKLSKYVDVYFNDEEYPFEDVDVTAPINKNINKPIEYKGYKIYNTDKETVFVNKINDGYSVWTLGNIVKNPKEVIDNIDKYTNEGGSTFVQTEEELQNELKTFGITENLNEGDVVSFTDFKRAKEADKFSGIDSTEMTNEVIRIKPTSINVIKCKSSDGFEPFSGDYIFNIKKFNARLEALHKLCNQGYIDAPLDCTYEIRANDSDLNTYFYTMDTEIERMTGDFDVANALTKKVEKETGKTCRIEAAFIPTEAEIQDEYNYIQELRKQYMDKPLNNEQGLYPAKDYSDGGKKKAQDVQVGDVLYWENYYGHTSVHFLKVIERKANSIKLASLEKSTQYITDDDGRVVPTKTIMKDSSVDGKLFRIHKQLREYDNFVCKIDGRYHCYYWNGKAKEETYMD